MSLIGGVAGEWPWGNEAVGLLAQSVGRAMAERLLEAVVGRLGDEGLTGPVLGCCLEEAGDWEMVLAMVEGLDGG